MMLYSTSFSSMVKVVGALPTVQVVPWVVLLAVNDVWGFGLFSLWLVEVHIRAILQNLNRLLLFFPFNNSISILEHFYSCTFSHLRVLVHEVLHWRVVSWVNFWFNKIPLFG